MLFSLSPGDDSMLKVTSISQFPAISVTSLRITRNVWDLLVVKPDHQLVILTHGTHQLPIKFTSISPTNHNDDTGMLVDSSLPYSTPHHGPVVSVQGGSISTVTVVFADGWKECANIDLIPQDSLTIQCLQTLSLTLPPDLFFSLHRLFLEKWFSRDLLTSNDAEFESFTDAIYTFFDLPLQVQATPQNVWDSLGRSASHDRLSEDPVLKGLRTPPNPLSPTFQKTLRKPHELLAAVLYALHTLGEDLRLMVHHYPSLFRLAPLICRIALVIRPEWADYWKRLCPHAMAGWPTSEIACEFLVQLYHFGVIDKSPQPPITSTTEYLYGLLTSQLFFTAESAIQTGKYRGMTLITWPLVLV